MTDDSLEQVRADIASFKAEKEASSEFFDQDGNFHAINPNRVFACTGIDETCGGADFLDCVCRDEDVHPQAVCPVHGKVFD